MKSLRFGFFFMILVSLTISSISYAGDESTGNYFVDSASKLARGVVNVAVSPAELSCAIYYDAETKPYTAAFTGIAKGTFGVARRILVGAAEAVTFMIPTEPWIGPVCQKSGWN